MLDPDVKNVSNTNGLLCQSFGSVSHNKACYDLKFHLEVNCYYLCCLDLVSVAKLQHVSAQ